MKDRANNAIVTGMMKYNQTLFCCSLYRDLVPQFYFYIISTYKIQIRTALNHMINARLLSVLNANHMKYREVPRG